MIINLKSNLEVEKLKTLLNRKNTTIDFSPEEIVFKDKHYFLKYPLRCLIDKDEDYIIIKSEILDIIGTGNTIEEAEESFSQEFDYIFSRYNELPDEKLSKRILFIKSFLNQIVINIEK